MNELQQHYLDNVRRARQFVKVIYSPDLDEDALVQAVTDNARAQSAIKAENDALLRDPAMGVALPLDQLSQDQQESIEDFAQHLAYFMRQEDNTLSYLLHRRLLEKARQQGNLDDQIKQSYFCGLTLYYLNKTSTHYHINLFTKQVREYFAFGGAYLDRLEDFASETQSYIIRSFGNIRLGYDALSDADSAYYAANEDEHEECMRITLALPGIFSDPALQAKAPQFNWTACLASVHLNVTTYLTLLRQKKHLELTEPIYQSACYIRDHTLQNGPSTEAVLKPSFQYIYMAASYHAGRCSLDELLRFLYDQCIHAAPDRYDPDSFWDNVYCCYYFFAYYSDFAQHTPEGDQCVDRLLLQMRRYVSGIPINEYLSTFTQILGKGFSTLPLQNDTVNQQLLYHLLDFHPPTFIHSQMVSRLACLLMTALMDLNPEYIVQHSDYATVEDVRLHREEILSLTEQCGQFHDIGKILIIDIIGQYSRRLFDEEFKLIQEHPYIGYTTLNLYPSTKAYAQAAMGHHCFYNEQGGYPACYRRTDDLNQIIIDLLTIADSMDAATDNIGRNYAKGITLEQLLKEFQAESGVRYAPFAVALLEHPAILKEAGQILSVARRQIYRDVYGSRENIAQASSPPVEPT